MFKITRKRRYSINGLPDNIPKLPRIGIEPQDIIYATYSNGTTRAMVTYSEINERKEYSNIYEWTGIYWKFINKI